MYLYRFIILELNTHTRARARAVPKTRCDLYAMWLTLNITLEYTHGVIVISLTGITTPVLTASRNR